MAFMKFVGSIILGGGIGYGLLCIVTPKESEIAQYLPPFSSEKRNILERYKSQEYFLDNKSQEYAKFMNKGRPKIDSKDHQTQDNTKVVSK